MTINRTAIRTVLSLLVLLSMGIGAIGCNTTEGAGKDIKAAGKGIENAANDAKP